MGARTLNLTASMIRSYKACPRLYWFQYVEQIKPIAKSEALETGSNYHECLERLLLGKPFDNAGIPGIMAEAFQKYVPWEEFGTQSTELEFRNHVGYGLYFAGKLDGVAGDGCPIEHKTTRDKLDEKYINKLNWDDQVTFYLLNLSIQTGKPITKVHYTACQKPTIRQKQKETEEEYLDRVRDWYDETKVKTFDVVRSWDEIKEKEKEVHAIAKEIRKRKIWYRNPRNCAILGCRYLPICLDYDPEIMVGFEKKTRRNEELCKF